MAKASKKTSETLGQMPEEVVSESVPQETLEVEVLQEEVVEEVATPIVEELIETSEPKLTETEFLQKILFIQKDGGFGRHLDAMIAERIKEINS